MKREDIIRMAREAGLGLFIQYEKSRPLEALERFAALVAAAEREACAKVCEDDCGNGALNLADAIRARGEKV